jgi:hypothetical protein
MTLRLFTLRMRLAACASPRFRPACRSHAHGPKAGCRDSDVPRRETEPDSPGSVASHRPRVGDQRPGTRQQMLPPNTVRDPPVVLCQAQKVARPAVLLLTPLPALFTPASLL